jgi:Tfp pilus assembly protein PilN
VTTLTPTQVAIMPRVNLLPPEIAAADRLRRLKLVLGGAVFGVLLLVLFGWFLVGRSLGSAQDELTQAQTEGNQLNQEIASYSEVPQVYSEVDAAQSDLVTAMTPEIRWSFFLNDLSLTMPKTNRLKTATFVNTAAAAQVDPAAALTPTVTPLGEPAMGTATFTGRATGFDAVAAWLQTLAKSKAYSTPTVTNVAEVDSEGTAGRVFDVESNAFLNVNAASNRYQQVEAGE